MVNLERLSELTKLCQEQDAHLVAVSKTKPNADILEVYHAGHKIFGENRVQEMIEKQRTLPEDIEWHMIGHLQSNKVKDIISFVRMIHAVDSLKLAREINKQSEKVNRNVAVLLQLHIAEESNKYGFGINELNVLLDTRILQALPCLQIAGLMGMATFTDDHDLIRKEFIFLQKCFREIKQKYFSESSSFRHISMGMSGDYRIALEEGATLIRVGSAIFGERT